MPQAQAVENRAMQAKIEMFRTASHYPMPLTECDAPKQKTDPGDQQDRREYRGRPLPGNPTSDKK
jgi:hypothetical protein